MYAHLIVDIRQDLKYIHTMYGCSEAAVMSGARIVHFCGHDCIPWEQQLAKALSQKDKDETLTEVCGGICIFSIYILSMNVTIYRLWKKFVFSPIHKHVSSVTLVSLVRLGFTMS